MPYNAIVKAGATHHSLYAAIDLDVLSRDEATLRSMTRSPFPWPGGKRALTQRLLQIVPPHRNYVEVFAGSAKLLFAKDPSKFEVINDLNGDVTNFFRICKHRTAELVELLELECIHAGRFQELRESPEPRCELERALRFAYLTWYSFGGKGQHFAQSSATIGATRRCLSRVRELLAQTAKRLEAVQIETQDFATILRRYDHPETFFYLDPPYVQYGSNGRYEPFTVERRQELFDQLAALKGRFLLSFDDHPEIRALAIDRSFHVREEQVEYSLGAQTGSRKTVKELLIANYVLVSADC